MLSTLIRLDKWRFKKVNLTEPFIDCRPAAKRSQKFIFEEIEGITRSRDFKDVIEALKHVVNKQQTSRFRVIMLIYEKNRLQNADITVERIVRKLTNSQSKLDRECSSQCQRITVYGNKSKVL